MTFKNILVIKLLMLLSFTLLLPVSSSHAHSGTATSAAWGACESKAKSEACEYKGFHGDLYRGTCQSISLHMMCVRNQPIIKAKPESDKTADLPKVSDGTQNN